MTECASVLFWPSGQTWSVVQYQSAWCGPRSITLALSLPMGAWPATGHTVGRRNSKKRKEVFIKVEAFQELEAPPDVAWPCAVVRVAFELCQQVFRFLQR